MKHAREVEITYLLKKSGKESSLHKKRDSSHSFGMTNNAVISTEGRNLFYQEPLGYPELLRRYEITSMTSSRGISLLEICIAAFLLALVAVPLYFHSSNDAVQNLVTEKIQKADLILQSIIEEISTKPFHRFTKEAKAAKTAPGTSPYPLTPEVFFPFSQKKILKIQGESQGFSVTGTWAFVERSKPGNDKEKFTDKTMVNVTVIAVWKHGNKEISRSRSTFLTQ